MQTPKLLHGTVIKGEQWGKMIGFPTANLSHEYFDLYPVPAGVYAAQTWVGRTVYPSSAIVGIRHLAAPKQRKIETHIIGKSLPLYGKTVTVELVEKLRGIVPFKDMPSLVRQIKRDNRAALRILSDASSERKAAVRDRDRAVRKALPVLRGIVRILQRELRPGVTEQAIAAQVRAQMRDASMKPAFPSPNIIVAFGPNASQPHHAPTQRRLRAGDCAKIDFGVDVDGWKTDITRTFFVGTPTSRQRALYALVLRAQAAGIHALRHGAVAGEVDVAARSIITRAGYGKRFIHGTGHALGKHIHESPSLRSGMIGRLHIGDLVTVEPGIYIPRWGGIRIEDMVEVTPSGRKIISSGIPSDLSHATIRV